MRLMAGARRLLDCGRRRRVVESLIGVDVESTIASRIVCVVTSLGH